MTDASRLRFLATLRIARLAVRRVLEPPTLHVMGAAMGATLAIGALEATLLCQQWPSLSWDPTTHFIIRYSVQNLFPSVVWETQPAHLVCMAMGLDPATVLRDLSGNTTESAVLLLQTHWLSTSRFFFAGFMMIAQLFRAATITMESFGAYEQGITQGREPPLLIDQGLVVRLCGRDSHVSEVSLRRMGLHLLPVFEFPDRVRPLVYRHSLGKRRPVYWCVPPDWYWSRYAWENFPADGRCFLTGTGSRSTSPSSLSSSSFSSSPPPQREDKILMLEADATNGNDPLTLGETSLDLTIEDASQGFRRILERYRDNGFVVGRDFRVLRVYLGNSMETTTTGGGYAYTLRHRIRYAKEMDVLIDSRAPVLRKILDWCEEVVASHDRKLFFQTSSREYFLNLQKLLKQYGYDIYDPLDLRMLPKLRESFVKEAKKSNKKRLGGKEAPEQIEESDNKILKLMEEDEWEDHGVFLQEQFWTGDQGVKKDIKPNDKDVPSPPPPRDMLRLVARLSRLPRLVHMETTAETVNAVEAMLAAGEIDASSCCALLDRHEGVVLLESAMKQQSGFVQSQKFQWQRQSTVEPIEEKVKKEETVNSDDEDEFSSSASASGLRIICSSTIHDDMFRQVRYWARQGYQAAEIQQEIDTQYQAILHQSHTVQREVGKEEKEAKEEKQTQETKEEQVADNNGGDNAGDDKHEGPEVKGVEPDEKV